MEWWFSNRWKRPWSGRIKGQLAKADGDNDAWDISGLVANHLALSRSSAATSNQPLACEEVLRNRQFLTGYALTTE